ncbi:hypothetical protein QWY81_17625 [Polaribacter undariae]|uniref:Cellobiose phosphorylase n=1 Tax=Polaribacter sejongensis TaxID=985043 RepID=A0AAJ1QZU3_9FLAO|nr:hypothetical protein [Polaribacter undariae]MDN3621291.1 hypothetical protein [Polaribacter undariae]UWD32145.1 hypothetical protein NQP51_00440 [Polaribacter undariae]
MTKKTIFLGNNKAAFKAQEVKGEMMNFENEVYYKISNSNEMRPFFMSIVSDSNHWMFISSNGGLSAGRKNSEYSLFPYYTDDKITESADITGSKSIFQVTKNDKTYVWEPFSQRQIGLYQTKQNLYKNSFGNKVIFEEINEDLGLTFRYQWSSSDQFGFVKKSTLINNSPEKIEVTFLDGLQNIIPSDVTTDLQNSYSNLVDAYKKSELQKEVGLGVYALSAIIVDKAEPSEALKANIVWSLGIENPTYLLSSLQLNNFRRGLELQQEVDVKAEKGAYFISSDIALEANESKEWRFIANVNQTIGDIQKVSKAIKEDKNLLEIITKDIELGTKNLIALTGAADGLQVTDDALVNTRHFANTLFNLMRGGTFDDDYKIEKEDFIKYISKANKKVLKLKEDVLNDLPELFTLKVILAIAEKDEDKNFKRLCFEYLPLKFSRRHGDPSRPWNKFSINTKNEIDGSKILDYEGNWRDIFQNWETLAHSYPEFIESMIHKFLNATTFDGYNPYRVTKDGFDWETIEENDPWSYIGYWGDHQIIYLLKFLEFIENHYPNQLEKRFSEAIFVYANVPYRIKKYEDILKNPKDTIDFDFEEQENIEQRRERLGADGALLRDENYFIYKVNLIEKLLATVLAKVSNFIPEGGIWMNTQRPEWNDANNALVGNGVSMVTLNYLNRFINFFEKVVVKSTAEEVAISSELATFFNEVVTTFNQNKNILSRKFSDAERKTVLDSLGEAGSKFRTSIYENGFSSDKIILKKAALLEFFTITKEYLDHTIKANKRTDNLYHSYNLMTIENDTEVSVSYLSEMLEGQVAVLSAGYLSSKEALKVLDGMKASALFREDQYSYILYPNKELARFDEKNVIPKSSVENSELLLKLITDNNTQIINKDVLGTYHFNANFNNANSLKATFEDLPEAYADLVEKEGQLLATIFEEVFNHKAFTGRSGTFFGYEGLGSIYWHMVSKLLLAVQENCLLAIKNNEDEVLIGALLDHYYEIQAGIGVHKSPELYGAFPTDPYSHTPGGKGAQQPGMTGQVKEDVLSRIGELGVFVKEGKINFNPRLLRVSEFVETPKTFKYNAINKEAKLIDLEKGSLCFTYCQVPVIYKNTGKESVTIFFVNGEQENSESLTLNSAISKMMFERTGEIDRIEVSVKK